MFWRAKQDRKKVENMGMNMIKHTIDKKYVIFITQRFTYKNVNKKGNNL